MQDPGLPSVQTIMPERSLYRQKVEEKYLQLFHSIDKNVRRRWKIPTEMGTESIQAAHPLNHLSNISVKLPCCQFRKSASGPLEGDSAESIWMSGSYVMLHYYYFYGTKSSPSGCRFYESKLIYDKIISCTSLFWLRYILKFINDRKVEMIFSTMDCSTRREVECIRGGRRIWALN